MPTITELRSEIIDLIEATFQTDPDPPVPPAESTFEPLFTAVEDGSLPRHKGHDGNYAGVRPESQIPVNGQQLDHRTTLTVQFYMKYEKTKPIDPDLVLSPEPVEDAVERFLEAVRETIGQNTSGRRWYYQYTGTTYPPDPIGQRTRAEITLVADGNNPALVETVP